MIGILKNNCLFYISARLIYELRVFFFYIYISWRIVNTTNITFNSYKQYQMINKVKMTSNNFKTKMNKEFKFDFKRYYILHCGTTVFM